MLELIFPAHLFFCSLIYKYNETAYLYSLNDLTCPSYKMDCTAEDVLKNIEWAEIDRMSSVRCAMYKKEELMTQISVEEFVTSYSQIKEYPGNCKSCPNYDKNWSCPPYDFDIKDIWEKYKTLQIYGVQIVFNDKLTPKRHTYDQLIKILDEALNEEHLNLVKKLEDLAHNKSHSLVLAPGKCIRCKVCARIDNQECRFPDQLHYSIESLGGDVVKAASNLLHIQFYWIQNGNLPEYLFLFGGLLIT